MRAGNLDRTIKIQSVTTTLDAYGAPTEVWADMVTLRAQVLKATTDEFIRGAGASDEETVVFRTWWVNGITNAHRIIFESRVHNIKEVRQIGRRNGLELRTISYGAAP